MSLQISYWPYRLLFRFEAGTSRGTLTEKTSWMIKIRDNMDPSVEGMGECGPLKGLSVDDRPDFETELAKVAGRFNALRIEAEALKPEQLAATLVPDDLPSIRFGVETALLDWQNGGKRMIFDNGFYRGGKSIPINGLIWMGKSDFMARQIEDKLEQGYTTLKLKIGAIDFDEELRLLESIRNRFGAEQVTVRVDANGAFAPAEALGKLKKLAAFDLHSIEQPIRAGQVEEMKRLVAETPVKIALDEELIGVANKKALLDDIRPHFIILKPTLLGGLAETRKWISVAEGRGIDWWMTSALESNIGLNAIAQFTAEFANPLPQGLGTGQLYQNNIPSSLHIRNGFLRYSV